MLFDLLFFSYLFPLPLFFYLYSRLVFLCLSSRDSVTRCLSILLYLLVHLVLTFFLPHTFCTFTSTPSRIILPHLTALVLPSFHLLCSVFSLISSLFSFALTHQGPRGGGKVGEEGGEKHIYSVAAECGSRRENCCFMVLFMDP